MRLEALRDVEKVHGVFGRRGRNGLLWSLAGMVSLDFRNEFVSRSSFMSHERKHEIVDKGHLDPSLGVCNANWLNVVEIRLFLSRSSGTPPHHHNTGLNVSNYRSESLWTRIVLRKQS